ncbi:protein stum homolog [Ornithodoros turicata]|uniref:protein stum homolog n=1 Tax=Ornithodoros turicata TaxID=34597 RepID=UPI0031397FC4
MSGQVRQIVVSVPTECCTDHQNGHPMASYEIISIRERHGRFRKAVPIMPMPIAVCLCILNVLLPGVGTLVTVIAVVCGCRTEHESRCVAAGYNLLASLLQTVTAPFVVGWVWSIMWGITFVNVSLSKRGNVQV